MPLPPAVTMRSRLTASELAGESDVYWIERIQACLLTVTGAPSLPRVKVGGELSRGRDAGESVRVEAAASRGVPATITVAVVAATITWPSARRYRCDRDICWPPR